MDFLKKLIFSLFFLISSFQHANGSEKISSIETTLLTPFFRLLLENTEAGYVLFHKKPICIQAYSENNTIFKENSHRFSVSLWGAKAILQRPLFQCQNICIRINPTDQSIFILNKKLFLKVVQENLPLFQYVLGPSVTPDSLLDKLLLEESSFNSVFNNDKVLIGIVLGYGVQHSLFVSRIENIMDGLLSQDLPPYYPKANLCNESWKEMLLFSSIDADTSINERLLKTSFGFSSISEEHEKLVEKIELPSESLTNQNPTFIFGCLKDAKDKKRVINDLEAIQQKILNLLQSSSFLQDVLALISREKIIVDRQKTYQFPQSTVNINFAIAKLIQSQIDDDPLSLSMFLSKFQQEDDDVTTDFCHHRMASFPEFISVIAEAKQHVEDANQFFADLDKNSNFTCVSKPYLYYSINHNGVGRTLDAETLVCVDFEIYDPNGKCLHCDSDATLNLLETIPGLTYGIKGMKIGEKRTILIHPSLGYGVHTYLEKGIYLKALVKLNHIYDSLEPIPPLRPIDLSFICSNEFQADCQKKRQDYLCDLGMQTAKFLKPYKQFNLKAIADALHAIKSENDNDISAEESNALNQIFWNHYFYKKEELKISQ